MGVNPVPFLLAAAMVLAASGADAATCGDHAGGRRVACRCGDTVVSDVVLQAIDPVVKTRCRLDGLIVRAARDAPSIRIDLAGLTLRGSGVASGIDVRYGGTDGAQIIGALGRHGSPCITYRTAAGIWCEEDQGRGRTGASGPID